MTIPRRLVLEAPKWCFSFDLTNLQGCLQAFASLFVAGFIILLDTIFWVFSIIVGAGPLVFSGLHEAVLDYLCIRHLEESHVAHGSDTATILNRKERVEILIAVLCGNLEMGGEVTKPQEEICQSIDLTFPPKTVLQLRAILASQYGFGAVVGAPILFYLGNFAYTIGTLSTTKGQHDTARALAFGIWWMCILHVTIISGSLLASNNPSTVVAIVGRGRDQGSKNQSKPALEATVQAKIEKLSQASLVYDSRYEPVWMWDRGKTKARWLRGTQAWKKDWFRQKIEISDTGWIGLIVVAVFLIMFPCAIAFWIEFQTPARGVACRALTIIVYTVGQIVMIILTAWSHFKASQDANDWTRHAWLRHLKHKWLGYFVALLLLFPAWLAALFATFAGTLMQITGIFENCLCGMSIGHWIHSGTGIVSLAQDTEADRLSSSDWIEAGTLAMVFLAAITYLGWWAQKYLRETFTFRVEKLEEPQRLSLDKTKKNTTSTNEDVHLESKELKDFHLGDVDTFHDSQIYHDAV
ncbi:hypothetical protein MMC20_000789 [Loxospora ochrophaea]|nr:hypothetical protein [Loxospora ochrophaea]